MNKGKTEKERKWILKNLPNIICDYRYMITQFYLDGYRYRKSQYDNFTSFEKIRKRQVAPGHNEELEIETITKSIFDSLRPTAEREITKVRYVYANESHRFEVDKFLFNLVILEIEDVELTDKINFIPEIQKEVICEVTHLPEFSNFNLTST